MIALVDTNSDTNDAQDLTAANDNAVRSVRLIMSYRTKGKTTNSWFD
jgi:ribosomal protein S2